MGGNNSNGREQMGGIRMGGNTHIYIYIYIYTSTTYIAWAGTHGRLTEKQEHLLCNMRGDKTPTD